MNGIPHDQIHKDFFHWVMPDFLEAFAPRLAASIDYSSLEFVEQSFGDLEEGDRKEVDILARFDLKGSDDGTIRFVYVHVEHQARPEKGFPARMFYYFAKIYSRYPGAIVYPIVLYTHDVLRPETDTFELNLFGREILRFHFHPIQLRRLNWREHAKTANPATTALLANMGKASEDRVERKLAAYVLLSQLLLNGTSENKIHFLTTYLDTYLVLDPDERLQFEEKVSNNGEETTPIMEYLTTVEKEALQEGREQGIEQGREQGIEQGREQGREQGMLRVIQLLLEEFEIRLNQNQTDKLGSLKANQLDSAAQILASNPSGFIDWLEG